MDIGMTTPPPVAPTTANAARLLADRVGPRPAISVYRARGERVEISGAVLANWAAKTAGLLTEELELASGESCGLRVSWGWRPVAIAVGAWSAGLEITEDENAAHLVSDDGETVAAHLARGNPRAWTVAVPTADLADEWDGPLLGASESLVDYAALVRGFDDVFVPLEPVVERRLSIPDAWRQTPSAEAPSPRRAVMLRTADWGPLMDIREIEALAALASSGTAVVLVTDPDADLESIAGAECAARLSPAS